MAILSTGVLSEHTVFAQDNLVVTKNFVGDNPCSYDDCDPEVIGTAVASVVGGSHIKRTRLGTEKFVCDEESDVLPVGVAPKALLVVCRVTEATSDSNPQAVLKALKWILNHNAAVAKDGVHCDCGLNHHSRDDEAARDKNKIRIILLSFKLERNVLAVGDVIDDLKKQGTVCVASCEASHGSHYPAGYSNVLSVGTSDTPLVDAVVVSDNTVCAGAENGLQSASGAVLSASAVVGLIALLLQCAREHAQETVTCERIMTLDVLRYLFQEKLMEGGSKFLVPEKVFKFFAYKLDNFDSIVKSALGL